MDCPNDTTSCQKCRLFLKILYWNCLERVTPAGLLTIGPSKPFVIVFVRWCSRFLSSEAGVLLLTFQNALSILLIFAIEQILQPLNILTLILQSPRLSGRVATEG